MLPVNEYLAFFILDLIIGVVGLSRAGDRAFGGNGSRYSAGIVIGKRELNLNAPLVGGLGELSDEIPLTYKWT